NYAQALQGSWSPDNQEIAYSKLSRSVIGRRNASGTGAEETMFQATRTVYLDDWSPDGRYLLYEEVDPETSGDLWLLPTTGERKPVLYLRTPGNELNGQFSPDGKWVAYVSDESGPEQVYVQSFPAPVAGKKWQISSNGGGYPRWRRDGK